MIANGYVLTFVLKAMLGSNSLLVSETLTFIRELKTEVRRGERTTRGPQRSTCARAGRLEWPHMMWTSYFMYENLYSMMYACFDIQ